MGYTDGLKQVTASWATPNGQLGYTNGLKQVMASWATQTGKSETWSLPKVGQIFCVCGTDRERKGDTILLLFRFVCCCFVVVVGLIGWLVVVVVVGDLFVCCFLGLFLFLFVSVLFIRFCCSFWVLAL